MSIDGIVDGRTGGPSPGGHLRGGWLGGPPTDRWSSDVDGRVEPVDGSLDSPVRGGVDG